MRLYKSYDGRWAGNLKDAKKFGGYHEMDMPTDKVRLLNFLNNYRVGNVFSDITSYQTENGRVTVAKYYEEIK